MGLLKPLTCCYCEKYFYSSDRRRRHIVRHRIKYTQIHNVGHRKLTVRRTASVDGLNETTVMPHYRNQTEEKRQCKYCQKYVTQTYLTSHIRIHTKEKPYQCEYCQKCFTQKSDLTRHRLIHTKEKPYQCEYCQKCFTQKSDLTRHVRIHNKEKPYQCEYCQKCFTLKRDLARHYTNSHEWNTHQFEYCLAFTQKRNHIKAMSIARNISHWKATREDTYEFTNYNTISVNIVRKVLSGRYWNNIRTHPDQLPKNILVHLPPSCRIAYLVH